MEMVEVLSSAETDSGNKSHSLVNLSTIAARATLDIISLATFGTCFNTLHVPNSHLSFAYKTIVTLGWNRRYRTALAALLPKKLLWALPFQRNDAIRESNAIIQTSVDTQSNRPRIKLLDLMRLELSTSSA